MNEQSKRSPLANTTWPVFLFIPVMAGAAALAKLLEYLYPNIDPGVFQNCAIGVGAVYMIGLGALWILFGRDLKPSKGRRGDEL